MLSELRDFVASINIVFTHNRKFNPSFDEQPLIVLLKLCLYRACPFELFVPLEKKCLRTRTFGHSKGLFA